MLGVGVGVGQKAVQVVVRSTLRLSSRELSLTSGLFLAGHEGSPTGWRSSLKFGIDSKTPIPGSASLLGKDE
jgi:hypothetical protein